MRVKSAARTAGMRSTEVRLHNGDHMDQKTFHELYKQTPEGFKAELIGGIVYVASPTSFRHGKPHLRLTYWLGLYVEATPGTDALDDTTAILDDDSEPEPDVILLIDPDHGGQTRVNKGGFLTGAPELVGEVAFSSASIDLNAKKRAYEAAGVLEYVVVLVESESVVWFTRRRNGFTELEPDEDGVLRSRVFPGLWLDSAGLFAKTTRRLSDTLRRGLASPEHGAFVARLERAAKRKTKPNGSK